MARHIGHGRILWRPIYQRCGGTTPVVTRSLGVCASRIRQDFAATSPRVWGLKRVRIGNVHLPGGDGRTVRKRGQLSRLLGKVRSSKLTFPTRRGRILVPPACNETRPVDVSQVAGASSETGLNGAGFVFWEWERSGLDIESVVRCRKGDLTGWSIGA